MDARTFETAARRWEGLGPYYAMFPTRFADEVISRHSRPGDVVLDPFAGRGTAVFSAAHQGRISLGIEINSVGWVYAKTKIDAAPADAVAVRIAALGDVSNSFSREADSLPNFFHRCYCIRVREFLCAARATLSWQVDKVDRTVMALLLVYLHGKLGAALSNQMRQTKSMAPDYAIRWWAERELDPPDLDPVAFMVSRLKWRYAKGVPDVRGSEILLGDSQEQLPLVADTLKRRRKRVSLIFTSPPYFALTNYHYDQWLRLWLLGGPPTAHRVPGTQDLRGRFENEPRYRRLLESVFAASSSTLSRKSTVYVRTGSDPITLDATVAALRSAFPRHAVDQRKRPYTRPTQTSLFGDSSVKAGEVDLILTRE
ncbi:DNA methyltransferase [Dactylosporangium sp. NPDC005572]|uniref:DNA methyltransferase n=1 Tax=Dactylosporangium sp. NPDC005572 TaxID=3156889 RepID=UPI0033B02808